MPDDGPRLVTATTRWTPPREPSLWDRILAFVHLGGTVPSQPPASVTAEFDQESYPPGDLMTVALKGVGQNVTLKSFTATFLLEDANVNPPAETTVQASSAVEEPNALAASAQTDTMGHTYTQGTPTQDGQNFSTTFTAPA